MSNADRFYTVWLNLRGIMQDLFLDFFEDFFNHPLFIGFIACVFFVLIGVIIRKIFWVVIN